jgi:hypothetical protein
VRFDSDIVDLLSLSLLTGESIASIHVTCETDENRQVDQETAPTDRTIQRSHGRAVEISLTSDDRRGLVGRVAASRCRATSMVGGRVRHTLDSADDDHLIRLKQVD